MAHLGRRPRASGSVIDLSQLPSPSPSGSYHLNHSDSTLSIRMPKRRWSNFDTTPLLFRGFAKPDWSASWSVNAAERVAHAVFLCRHVEAVIFVRLDFDRHVFNHFETIAFKPDSFHRIVGHEPHFPDAE